MSKIDPQLWYDLESRLKDLEPLAKADGDPVFEAIVAGRALMRAAGVVNEAPDFLEHPDEKLQIAARKRRKVQPKITKEAAVNSGFTGDQCPSPSCREFTMVRSGTCMRCVSCGTTSGCS